MQVVDYEPWSSDEFLFFVPNSVPLFNHENFDSNPFIEVHHLPLIFVGRSSLTSLAFSLGNYAW